MHLPLVFKEGLSCLMVGGGQVASRKIEILLEARCNITVVAPQVSGCAAEEARRKSIRWLEREFVRGDCQGFQLVIAATPVQSTNRQISEEARELGIPVNVVDDPELSTVIFPAIWRDKSLLIAVSTEGTAPFMAAEVRNQLARCAQGMGRWIEIGGRFRDVVRDRVKDSDEKKRLYNLFAEAGPPDESEDPPESGRLSDWLSWLETIRKPLR